LFIAAFLYFFKPFGMHREPHPELVCLAYGGVTFFCCTTHNWFLTYALRIETDSPNWSLWKWSLSMLGLLVWIAVGNVCLMDWLYPHFQLTWASFLVMLRDTLLLGTIPVVVSGLLIQLRAARRFQAEAQTLDSKPKPEPNTEADEQTITFAVSAEQNQTLTCDQIAYVQAMQNYVVVHYHTRSGGTEKMTVRDTISNTLQALVGSSVVRCHRSYLVNYAKVAQVEGNAQGLKLRLSGFADVSVPVSRSYVPEFKAHIN
jgi:hypothetical protein